jgi:hypothetical protein
MMLLADVNNPELYELHTEIISDTEVKFIYKSRAIGVVVYDEVSGGYEIEDSIERMWDGIGFATLNAAVLALHASISDARDSIPGFA